MMMKKMPTQLYSLTISSEVCALRGKSLLAPLLPHVEFHIDVSFISSLCPNAGISEVSLKPLEPTNNHIVVHNDET